MRARLLSEKWRHHGVDNVEMTLSQNVTTNSSSRSYEPRSILHDLIMIVDVEASRVDHDRVNVMAQHGPASCHTQPLLFVYKLRGVRASVEILKVQHGAV